MSAKSPYDGKPISEWKKITENLIKEHPLNEKDIVSTVLESWESIFESTLGRHGLKIGVQIFPKPQIMGFLLHEIIQQEFVAKYPGEWRGEETSEDKDLVCILDDNFSIEIKTSSNQNQVFGNRSYAQESINNRKSKSGFYLAVNFDKFSKSRKKPEILLIRFGWIDHDDWIGQAAATGQQARLSRETYENKFKTLHSKR